MGRRLFKVFGAGPEDRWGHEGQNPVQAKLVKKCAEPFFDHPKPASTASDPQFNRRQLATWTARAQRGIVIKGFEEAFDHNSGVWP